MKNFITNLFAGLALSIFSTCPIWAQSSAGENININNIDAMLRPTGDHFWDLMTSAKYEVPKGSRKHTIFASSLWIGGFNNNNLHTAAMTYRQTGSDFWPGPLDTTLATIDEANSWEWDKMWKVSKAEIEAFKNDVFQATEAIKSWPAHGNESLGEAKYLAPFVDVDNNGIYDYTKGDYPKIKGDQAVWWIFNDRNLGHAETEGTAFGVEIRAMAYAFASTDSVLNNTLFFEYDIINRSDNNYKDVYLGLWTDFDLGYSLDAAIGCDSTLSAYFAYNGDPFDEGVNGYGSNIPVQSVVFLKDSMKNFMYYNNDFTNNGNPSNPIHYYRYLKSRYKDDEPVINPVTNLQTTFTYPGNPLDSTSWTDRKSNLKPGDRRGLGSTGPFELKRNKKLSFHFAYVTTFKQTGSTDANLAGMYGDIAQIKNYYKNNLATGVSETKNKTLFTFGLNAYPNPANGLLNLQWNNSSAENVRLVNMLGQTVWSQNVRTGESKILVDTKHFPAGIYMAIVEKDGEKAVTRVVLE